MQLAETETEALELLKHQLERSIAGSSVTTLSRNNSADRLVATTPVASASALAGALADAKPRSCLAVRFADTHSSLASGASLVGCKVCGESGARTTCVPLLVGGVR